MPKKVTDQKASEEAPERDTLIVDDDDMREGFTMVPNILLRCKDPVVSHSAKLLYAVLLSYAWQEDSCFPGQDRLAKDLCSSRFSVIRYLAELQQAGLVVVTRRGLGRTNVYRLPKLSSVIRPDVAALQHPEVAKPQQPKVARVQRQHVAGVQHKEHTGHQHTEKKTGSPTPLKRRGRAGAAPLAEDPTKFYRGRYALCPRCNSNTHEPGCEYA